MLQSLLSFVALLSTTFAFSPIYGPTFPLPRNFANIPPIRIALDNLTSTLNTAFNTGASDYGPQDPASAAGVQIFSLCDNDSQVFAYYHNGKILSNATGVQKIDGDSIWRIGSLSKLVTVYLVLAELRDGLWDMKVTQVIPELRRRTTWGGYWEEVALGSLASHLSGLTQNRLFPSFVFPCRL